LDTLENGYDSFEIRIWLTYKIDTFQILILKNFIHIWDGVYYEIGLHLNDHRDSVLYYSKTQKSVSPKCGWHKIIDSLIQLSILTLPDCTKIINVSDLPLYGGSRVTFETSSLKNYRLFMYELPSHIRKIYKEALDVDNILNLISRQFDIKYLGEF